MTATRSRSLITHALTVSCLLASAAAVGAQAPTTQAPRPSQQQPQPRGGDDTAAVETSIEGCVTRATSQDTSSGAPAFTLTDAKMPERETTVPRTPADQRIAAAERKTPDTTPTSLVVRLDAGPELKLESHVNHRIVARGTLSDAPAAGQDGKSAPRTLKVTGIEMVSATCAKQ